MNSLNGLNLGAVALGAALGGVVRWICGLLMSGQGGAVPLGTLFVNCLGGLLVGLAMVWFSRSPQETLRLLCVTGFLGGFTTFSTFSSESLSLLQRGEPGWALAHSTLHVLGALGCTALGVKLGRIFWEG